MNIAYLLYREDIFSPLVEGQVLNILRRVVKEGNSVYFIWLKRVDYCFKYKDKIQRVYQRLRNDGIVLHEIPIMLGKFPLNKSMSDFVYLQASSAVRSILKKNNIQIIHTRGYNAGLFITKLLKNNKEIKHVFDPRSPYLTEIVSTYGVKENDQVYQFWKMSEKEIVSTANVTVAISDTFADYLRQYTDRINVIPNNSEMEEPDIVIERAKRQRRKSFCFVGSLGYGWNNVHEYISFMKKVWDIDPEILLELYVLKQDIVREELKKAGIPEEKYVIKTLPQTEVGRTISGCLAGLQIMSMQDTRLGIKTVDYLAAGVPVICNNNAMGAAKVIAKYNVGWNIDTMKLREILGEINQISNFSSKAAKVAYVEFSTSAVSKKYEELYLNL